MANNSNRQLWVSKLHEANFCYKNGCYNEAIKNFNLAYSQIKNNFRGSQSKFDAIFYTCKFYMGKMKSNFQLHNLKVAKDYFERAISCAEKCSNTLRAECHYIKGNICIKEEKFDKALVNFELATNFLNQINPDKLLISIRNDIAITHIKQHKHVAATEILVESIKNQLKLVLQTGIKKDNLPTTGLNLSKIEQLQTENLLNDITEILKSLSYTKTELNSALLYDTIGNFLYVQYNYAEAIHYYEKSIGIKRKILKKNSWYMVNTLEYLGNSYFAMDHFSEAEAVYKELLRIKEETKSNDNRLKAKLSNALGEIAFKNFNYDDSIKYHHTAMTFVSGSEIRHDKFELSNAIYGIGKAFQSTKKFDKALNKFELSLEIQQEVLGSDHLLIAQILDSIAEVLELQNQIQTSKEKYVSSFTIRENFCNKIGIYLVRSYYSEVRLEKYQRKTDQPLSANSYWGLRFREQEKLYKEEAKILEKIGKMYKISSNFSHSLSYYNKALDLIKELEEINEEDFLRLTNEINNISKLTMKNSHSRIKKASKNSMCDKQTQQLKNLPAQAEAIKQIFELAYKKAFEDGKCCNLFANIILIGPNDSGKSHIYKLLTKQTQNQGSNSMPVFIDLDKIDQINHSAGENILNRGSYLDNKVLSFITKQINLLSSPEVRRLSSTSSNEDRGEFSDNDKIAASGKVTANLSRATRGNSCLQHNDGNVVKPNSNDHVNPSGGNHNSVYPLFWWYFQKYNQTDEYNSESRYAKIWNFDNPVYYQSFKFQHNIYIAPFDINIQLKEVKSVNDSADCHDYIALFQEWLINAVDWTGNKQYIDIEISKHKEEVPLPLVLLVAINNDSSLDETTKQAKRNQFIRELDKKMPRSNLHFYFPDIIINCDPDNNDNDHEESNKSWNKLCDIIKKFIQASPSFNWKIKMRWYIMAQLIFKSIADENNRSTPVNSKCQKFIHTFQEIKSLAKNLMTDSEIICILKFLHNIGEVLFYHQNEAGGLVVTNTNWFFQNLRLIFDLTNNKTRLASNRMERNYCQWAQDYGIISKASFKYAIRKNLLNNKDEESLLKFLELNSIIYKSSANPEVMQPIGNDLYLVPYFLHSRKVESDDISRDQFESNWLYLGFSQKEPIYITDQIFYQFLSLWPSNWNVHLYHHSAKYLPRERNYSILVIKEETYIKIRYCHQLTDQEDVDIKLKKEAISSLSSDQPHIILKNLFYSTIKNLYPRGQEIQYEFYIQCSKCYEMIVCSEKIESEIMQCSNTYCRRIFSSNILEDWKSVLYPPSLPSNKETSSSTAKNHLNSANLLAASKQDEETLEISNDYETQEDNNFRKRKRNDTDLRFVTKKRLISLSVQNSLENNHERFVNMIPIDGMWTSLLSRKIVNASQVDKWKGLSDTDIAEELWQLLRNKREDDDFYNVCEILKDSEINAVINLGSELESMARD
ncbi:Nephrocystin-3 [Trichoplax sp. H2]|nr:Nephrocystin-3 [Trichoplax sp. H2]|eukprot:RDD36472.1 Nephrocystin-3 [Trichoplax sp. H2]